MRKFIYFFILTSLIFSDKTFAQDNQRSVTKAGAVAFSFFGGYESLSAINENGLNTSFGGSTFGYRIGLKPLPSLLTGFYLFVDGTMSNGENRENELEEYESTTTRLGFTQYLARFLYVGGFYGQRQLKVENAIPSAKIESSAKLTGIGFGVDLFSGLSWALTLEAWHYSGYAPKSSVQNYNLGTSSAEYYLGVRWSPSVTVSW